MAERIIYEQIKQIEKKAAIDAHSDGPRQRACPKRHQGFQTTRTRKRKQQQRSFVTDETAKTPEMHENETKERKQKTKANGITKMK